MGFDRKDMSFVFAWIALVTFTVLFILKSNYEFLVYAISIAIVLVILRKADKKLDFMPFALWCFAIWVFLHVAGGYIHIAGTRLYDYMLVNLVGEPYMLLKFDQLMHSFSYFTITMLVFSLFRKHTDHRMSRPVRYLLLGLSVMGISALYEILEFSTVVMFTATGVGGYYNNSLDLVFNFLGILIAIAALHLMEKNNKK